MTVAAEEQKAREQKAREQKAREQAASEQTGKIVETLEEYRAAGQARRTSERPDTR